MIPEHHEESSYQSQRSQSYSSAVEANVYEAMSNALDKRFAIYDELNRIYPVSGAFSMVSHVVFLIQLFSVFSWFFIDSIWDLTDPTVSRYRYFMCLADFGIHYKTDMFNEISPVVYVLMGVSLLSSLFVTLVCQHFQKSKTINKGSLAVTRLLVSLIGPIIIIPCSHATGTSFIRMVYNPSAVNIVVFAFSFIGFAGEMGLAHFTQQITTNTPFVPSHQFAIWDGSLQFDVLFIGAIYCILQSVVVKFPFWFHCIVSGMFDLAIIFSARDVIYYVYFENKSGAIFAAALFGCASFGILSFLPVLSIVRIVVPYALLVVFGAVFYFLLNFYEKRVIKNGYETNTERGALRSLRIQIKNDPENFLKMTLIREIMSKFTSTHVMTQIARVLSMLPSEAQLLNQFLTILLHRTDLSASERFCFFQIRRVHILRQSSASRQMSQSLIDLRKITSRVIVTAQQFWTKVIEGKQVFSLGSLVSYFDETLTAKMICLDEINKYPNSASFVREYSKLLIECSGDFIGGTELFLKSEMIEQGHLNTLDYAFRAFINRFPIYLKKKFLDFRGKKIMSKERKGSQSSGSASSSSSAENLTENQLEEAASAVMDHNKLRFALQKALFSLQNPYLITYKYLIFFRIFISLVVVFCLLFAFRNTFTPHKLIFEVIEGVSYVRSSMALSLFAMSQHMAKVNKMLLSDALVDDALQFNEDEESLIMLDRTHFGENNEMLSFWANKGIESVNDLNDLITTIAESYQIFGTLDSYYGDSPCVYCTNSGTRLPERNLSGDSIIDLLFQRASSFSSTVNETNWKTSSHFCELISNYRICQNITNKVIQSFMELSKEIKMDDRKMILIITIVLMIACGCLFLFPFLYAFINMKNNFGQFITIALQIPKDGIEKTLNPIIKVHEIDGQQILASAINLNSRFSPLIIPPLCIVAILIIGFFMVGVTLYFQIETIDKFTNLNKWISLSRERMASIVESVSIAVLGAIILTKGPFAIPSISSILLRDYFLDLANVSLECNRKLLYDNDSARGFSTDFDNYHFSFDCQSDIGQIGIHDIYRCEGIDRLMLVFHRTESDFLAFFTKMATVRPLPGNPLVGDDYVHLKHLLTHHLYPLLVLADNQLKTGYQKIQNEYNVLFYPIVILGAVVGLLVSAFELFNLQKIFNAFEACKNVLSRFPPQFIISYPPLLNFVLGKEDVKQQEKSSSAEQSVIDSSPDAIVAVDSEMTIESMNPAASTIFGYTIEQLLGKNIDTILPMNVKINDQFYHQMNLMKSNQVGMTYSVQLTGERDDGTEINLDVTLLGINNGESFAMIMNDMTAVMKAQMHVEQAKKKAEKLLYQILPRDIVNRINQGETEISFTVNSATIIFIDIIRFSEYSATLSAKQIMQNLGLIFKTFDDLLERYETIIKIKLIGDIYMAAAGLFHPQIHGDVHATEIVLFAIDAIHALEEINHQLESNLQVRIGINSAGPLIAGVLGIDKPLFDIIGDPINVAARLQSTDLPNHIQISTGTYSLIKNKGFKILERGEVQLKGKGLQMAYFVSPDDTAHITQEHLSCMQLPMFSALSAENSLQIHSMHSSSSVILINSSNNNNININSINNNSGNENNLINNSNSGRTAATQPPAAMKIESLQQDKNSQLMFQQIMPNSRSPSEQKFDIKD